MSHHLVSNASPLIVLAKEDLLRILPALFPQVLVPQAVVDEIGAGPADDPMRLTLASCAWLVAVRLEPPLSPLITWRAGRGEAEVIEYARLNGNLPVLLDDRAALRFAKALGLTVHGCVGLVGTAVKTGILESFPRGVAQLRAAGLYISGEVVEDVAKGLRQRKIYE